MTSVHSGLTGLQLHEAFHYVDAADPGAVGADKYWLDISADPYVLRRRDPTDTSWIDVTGAGASILERDFAYQRQTDQTIPTATNTAVEFTATFMVDNGGFFDIGTPTRFTVPNDGFSSGTYEVSATVRWTGGGTGIRSAFIRKNGTDVFAYEQIDADGMADDIIMNCVAFVVMAATDYFELLVEQESGGDLDIISANFYAPVIRGHLIH